MKILITGAEGFLGKEISKYLKEAGMDVYGTANRTVEDPHIFKVDITKLEDFDNIPIKPEVILHLAAVREEFGSEEENRKRCMEVNANGTLNVANFASKVGTRHFIYVSSNTVYGRANKIVNETDKPEPISQYGTSKYKGELFCNEICSKNNIELTILRFAGIFGNGQKKFLIYYILSCIQDNKDITIYGKGEGRWDLLYVKDILEVILNVIRNKIYGTYNIGSGKIISVTEIAETALRAYPKSSSKIVYESNKEENTDNLLMDVSKARREIGVDIKFDIKKALEDMEIG